MKIQIPLHQERVNWARDGAETFRVGAGWGDGLGGQGLEAGGRGELLLNKFAPPGTGV